MMIARAPQHGRIHPLIVAKVASDDPQHFSRNYLSAHTRMSWKAVLVYVAVFALFIVGLMLLG